MIPTLGPWYSTMLLCDSGAHRHSMRTHSSPVCQYLAVACVVLGVDAVSDLILFDS